MYSKNNLASRGGASGALIGNLDKSSDLVFPSVSQPHSLFPANQNENGQPIPVRLLQRPPRFNRDSPGNKNLLNNLVMPGEPSGAQLSSLDRSNVSTNMAFSQMPPFHQSFFLANQNPNGQPTAIPTLQTQPPFFQRPPPQNMAPTIAFPQWPPHAADQIQHGLAMPTAKMEEPAAKAQTAPKLQSDLTADVMFLKKLMTLVSEKTTPMENSQMLMFEQKELAENILSNQHITIPPMASTENYLNQQLIRLMASQNTASVSQLNQQLLMASQNSASVSQLNQQLMASQNSASVSQLNQQLMASQNSARVSQLNQQLLMASQNSASVSQLSQNTIQMASEANNAMPMEQAQTTKDKILLMLSLLQSSQKSGISQMNMNSSLPRSQNLLNQAYGHMDGNAMMLLNQNAFKDQTGDVHKDPLTVDVESPCTLYGDKSYPSGIYSKEYEQSTYGNDCTNNGDPQEKTDEVPYTRIQLSPSAARSENERFQDFESDAGIIKQSQDSTFDHGVQRSRPSKGPNRAQREGGVRHEQRGKLDKDFVSPPSAEKRKEHRIINRSRERTSDHGIQSSRPADDPERAQRESGLRYEKSTRLDKDFISQRSTERQEEHGVINQSQEKTFDHGLRRARHVEDPERPQMESGGRFEKRGRLDKDFVSPRSTERQEDNRIINRSHRKSLDHGIRSSKAVDDPQWAKRESGVRYEKCSRLDKDFVSPHFAERWEDCRNQSQERTFDHGIQNLRPTDNQAEAYRESGECYEKHGRDFVPPPSKARREKHRITNKSQEKTFDYGTESSRLYDPEHAQRESGVREKRGRLDKDFVSPPFTERQEEHRILSRSHEKTFDRCVRNSRPVDDSERAQRKSGVRYEKHGRLDKDFDLPPSTERWEVHGINRRSQERTFDRGIESSRPLDDSEWTQGEHGMQYEKHTRLDKDFVSPHSTERREKRGITNRSQAKTFDHGIKSSRPNENPGWAQRESGVRYEKHGRLDRDFVSSPSPERWEAQGIINRSRERDNDDDLWSSRPVEDHEWTHRKSGMRHDKHARLNRGFVSPPSTERREKNRDDSTMSLPADVLKRIRGKDMFTVSAILSEYEESRSSK